MVQNASRVLLILPQDVLDRARVVAGQATAALKLPVSLQIVLRALIGEGLKREGDRNLLTNIAVQAQAIRRSRRGAGKGGTPDAPAGEPAATGRKPPGAGRAGRRGGRAVRRGAEAARMRSTGGKRYDGKR